MIANKQTFEHLTRPDSEPYLHQHAETGSQHKSRTLTGTSTSTSTSISFSASTSASTLNMSGILQKIAIALITIAISALSTADFAFAQQASGMDKELMKRDLEIMESVLDRILAPVNGTTIRIGGSSTSAIYLPGFGVLIENAPGLRVPGASFRVIDGQVTIDRQVTIDTNIQSGRDENAGRTQPRERTAVVATSRTPLADVDADSMIIQIAGFLKNYAVLINQLDADDRVAVIYNNRGQVFMPALRSRDADTDHLQSLSVVARFSDLEAYRRGRMTDEALGQRLAVRKMMSGTDPRTDLEIFGRILETGLKTDDRESISLRGNISHFHVEGAGAVYNLQAGMSSRGVFSVANMENLAAQLQEQGRRIEQQAEQLRQQAREIEVMARTFPADSINFGRQLNLINARLEALYPDPEKVKQEFGVFERNLKAYMVDYGRTLSSVKAGESLFVSVTLSGMGRTGLPGRVVYKIDRADIESFDRRNITRDQAIGRITRLEY
jgi:hypothetical protein